MPGFTSNVAQCIVALARLLIVNSLLPGTVQVAKASMLREHNLEVFKVAIWEKCFCPQCIWGSSKAHEF